MTRCGVYLLIVALATFTTRIEARHATPRLITDVRLELLRQQAGGRGLLLELLDGSRVSGTATRLEPDDFQISGHVIAYSTVGAFLDPATGKPVAVVQEALSTQSFSPRQYSTKTVVIVAVAVAVFLIWLRLAVPRR